MCALSSVRAILAHKRRQGLLEASRQTLREQPATEAPGLNAKSGLETNFGIGFQTHSLGHTSRGLNTLQVLDRPVDMHSATESGNAFGGGWLV